jgi:hypothetical protein
MLRHVLTLASITVLTSACGAAVKPAPRTAKAAIAPKAAPKHVTTEVAAKTTEPAEAPSSEDAAKAAETAKNEPPKPPMRKLGDFHVYQYSGAFAKEPVTLTEQVVAMDKDLLVVDFVLEEGSTMSALRVRMKPDNDVVSVSRITDDGEAPATVADYDALMQKTELVPDSNDAVLGAEHTSCLVGEEQVACDVTTYEVTYGKKHAKLTITTSPDLPGRDIGGDVVADDGKVLYSARLVERGNEPPVVEALAKLDRFVPDGP